MDLHINEKFAEGVLRNHPHMLIEMCFRVDQDGNADVQSIRTVGGGGSSPPDWVKKLRLHGEV